MCRHDVADQDTAQSGSEPGLMLFGCRAVDEEEADQHEPQSGEAGAGGKLKKPQKTRK
jgi:hypothetical protein